MPRLLLRLIVTLAIGALLLGTKGTIADGGANALTYKGTFDQPGADPGTVFVTLTPDRLAVRRLEVRNLVVTSFPNGVLTQVAYGRAAYYFTPLPLVDGSMEASMALNTIGMLRSYIDVALQVDSSEQLSGTVELRWAGPVLLAHSFLAIKQPYRRGDVNCNDLIDALDALVVLQFQAGRPDSFACGENADVNLDGSANSIDGALILQYTAGLLDHL